MDTSDAAARAAMIVQTPDAAAAAATASPPPPPLPSAEQLKAAGTARKRILLPAAAAAAQDDTQTLPPAAASGGKHMMDQIRQKAAEFKETREQKPEGAATMPTSAEATPTDPFTADLHSRIMARRSAIAGQTPIPGHSSSVAGPDTDVFVDADDDFSD